MQSEPSKPSTLVKRYIPAPQSIPTRCVEGENVVHWPFVSVGRYPLLSLCTSGFEQVVSLLLKDAIQPWDQRASRGEGVVVGSERERELALRARIMRAFMCIG